MRQSDKFKDLEYAQISKNGKQVLFIAGKELVDSTKFGLLAYVGEKLGDGMFSIRYKERSEHISRHMTCRSIVVKQDKQEIKEVEHAPGLDFIFNRFNDLEKNFETVKNKLEDSKEQNFNLRLQLLEKQKDGGIDLGEILTNLASMLIKNRLGGALTQPASLAEPMDGSMPNEIKVLLDKIDWSRVSPDQLNNVLKIFEQYKNLIPLKG